MPWVVEQAKLKSTCETCRRAIPKGEWRFGKNHGEARWFHLRCGSRGAPEMFPPFAKQVQQILTRLGFYEGEIDGAIGSGSKASIMAFQSSVGMEPDGNPSKTLLKKLKGK